MKKQFALFVHLTHKINRHHVQLALTLASVILLVIGVGAPSDTSGVGPR